MSAMILYWSLGGTTKRVAEAIAEGLRGAGVGCELHDLRTGAPEDLAAHEIVGIGFPVHYYALGRSRVRRARPSSRSRPPRENL